MGALGLALIFIIGTTRPINLGALALIMTFVIGAGFAHEPVADMYRGFPVDLFVLLTGVTYLFAIASHNGTIGRMVEWATSLAKGRRTLIPWIAFSAASLPAMAGALGSAGVALLAPLSLRLAERFDLDRRMVGLMVVHGASAGNFSPLNPLGALVNQAMARSGLPSAALQLFLANLGYNIALGAIIVALFGRPRSRSNADQPAQVDQSAARFTIDQRCTVAAILAVAIAALGFGLSIGFLAFGAGALLQLLFPKSSLGAEKHIAWNVVLLVCGIVTYVAALQRYGTVQAAGAGIAALGTPLLTVLLLCAVGAVTSAFASSAGILGALIPFALPFTVQNTIDATALVIALAISVTVVDGMPFSTVGALVVANADETERPRVYRGLLRWGSVMVVTAPLLTWLIFILPSS
ncbi:MAG TPA: SLC13 family permease [Longimicrobiales bacterium]|nr:SLC13 family permease [Longimicrobiales bacterium]